MSNNDIRVLFTTGNDDYSTPSFIYNQIKELGMFDPCPFLGKENEIDGLNIEWKPLNFVNPPYSNIAKWIDKTIFEHKEHKNMTLLLPFSRTETRWFRKLWVYGCDFWFITGRLTFNENNENAGAAPMGNALILTTGLSSRSFLVDRDKISIKQILNSHYGRRAEIKGDTK